MSSSARRTALVCIVLANVLGGVSYPAQKAALAGLPPATVSLLRNLVGALALGLCLAWRRRAGVVLRPWTRAENARVLALGTVAFALPMWLGIVGVELSSASNASILILLEPVTIVAIAWLVLGEKVGPAKLAMLALGLVGAMAIVLEGAALGGLFASQSFAGNLILALHGVLWGCYTPIAKPLSERHDAFDLCQRANLVSLVALMPLVGFEWLRFEAGPALVPSLLWTAALGLAVSFGGTVLWLLALRHLPATSVAGFVFLQPLAGVLVGSLGFGERLSLPALFGGALIVAGVALDAWDTARGPGGG
jgi:drug/metabolite transporter (DMT)-like permease